MSSATSSASVVAASNEPALKRFLRATEVDTRMIGMIMALLLIWIGFQVYGAVNSGSSIFSSSGNFISPRNLWNLSVQTSSIAVMTSGMVLIIVMRHIDLSAGSILGFTGMVMGVAQVKFLPQFVGLGHPSIWILTILIGVALGALIGAFHGYLIAYLGIPAFIVTLGGLLFWRGAAYLVAAGATIAPLDGIFSLIGGGGANGSIGASASWVLGLAVCLAVIAGIVMGRRRRTRFNFPLRPIWAETLLALVGCGIAILVTWIVNSYYWAPGIVRDYAAAHNIEFPEGVEIPYGYAIPVLLALAIAIAMSFVATRTRFGRYVYAIGGNPEAAELAGVNTKKITLMVFALMGGLTAISACIATARVQAATNALGVSDELYVIAAAVIGGTSLAGGVGTIYGAIIGALVMQSLQSGMVLIGFDAALQQMVVGAVLVAAVFVDTLYRRRTA